MRSVLFIATLIWTLASTAQTEQEFLHSKGYLVKGMATLELEANRTGWWRLSPAVAVRYGLNISEAYDGRKDPVFSTQAAREWWSDLYSNFEDSLVADYAFVYGPAPALKLSHDAIAYVQWKNLVKEWQKDQMDSLPDWRLKELEVAGSVYWPDLKTVMGWSESDWNRFKSLNPGLGNDHLVDDETALIRFETLPSEVQMQELWNSAEIKDSIALAGLARTRNRIANNIPDPSSHNRVVYRVRSGDVLGSISQRYHVGLSDLKKWNNLRSDIIRVGQELVVYVPRGVETAAVTPRRAVEQDAEVRSDEEDREEVQYKVKTGDTLWSIARNYPGVSADDIMRWNGIDEDIREGQVLLILPPKKGDQ